MFKEKVRGIRDFDMDGRSDFYKPKRFHKIKGPYKHSKNNAMTWDYFDRKGNLIWREQEGWFGINFHHASKYNTIEEVKNWSAGCQVINHYVDFEVFLHLISEAEKNWGKGISYGLIDFTDIRNAA